MKKIVLLGPECTGKTTLARDLAQKYHGAYAPEYSRPLAEALRSQGRDLGFEHVMPIVQGQLEAERQAAALSRNIAFLDGNPLGEAVYSQWYYDRLPDRLPALVATLSYDFYLLCYPDIPWEPDPARDMPTGRENIFEEFKKAVVQSGTPYSIVKGLGAARLQNAEAALRAQNLLP